MKPWGRRAAGPRKRRRAGAKEAARAGKEGREKGKEGESEPPLLLGVAYTLASPSDPLDLGAPIITALERNCKLSLWPRCLAKLQGGQIACTRRTMRLLSGCSSSRTGGLRSVPVPARGGSCPRWLLHLPRRTGAAWVEPPDPQLWPLSPRALRGGDVTPLAFELVRFIQPIPRAF